MSNPNLTDAETFEVGKVYMGTAKSYGWTAAAYLVTKISRGRKYRHGRGVSPNDWVTFQKGSIRDGKFTPYDHQKPFRRKVQNQYGKGDSAHERAEVEGWRGPGEIYPANVVATA